MRVCLSSVCAVCRHLGDAGTQPGILSVRCAGVTKTGDALRGFAFSSEEHMLGLYTKNGWRAGFAIAVTGTLIGLGMSPAMAAEHAEAEAQAIKTSGAGLG